MKTDNIEIGLNNSGPSGQTSGLKKRMEKRSASSAGISGSHRTTSPSGKHIKGDLAKSIPEEMSEERSAQSESSSKELFRRSPRIQDCLPVGKIEIPAPPAEASKPEINWLSTLLPAGVTITIAVVMALAFQNTMMMLYSLPMTVAGLIISITNYLRGTKKYQKSSEERRHAYLQLIENITADINEKRDAQSKAMLLADPSPRNCFLTVKSRNAALWCREPNDADFVSVRLGTGSVPFSVRLDRPREKILEEDDLSEIPAALYRNSATIENMPVLCDIRRSGAVGVIGTSKQTREQLQNMIYHLSTNHCYTDLKLVCFYNEDNKKDLAWLKDLPHTHGISSDESYLVWNQKDVETLFRSFAETFKQRKQELLEDGSYGSHPLFVPYILFVFFEPKLLKKSDPINQYLFSEQNLGVGCLMAVEDMSQLPKQFTEIITISNNHGQIYNTARASEKQDFQPDIIPASRRIAFGELMRPLYCDESISVSTLPKSYSFYQLLGVKTIDQFSIGKSWNASDLLTSDLSPSAPIGILENGEKVYFNSPPTGDNGGAHALVAGTAGSGKSEALLTLIFSLALRYSPEEISFLVIDFKGDSLAGKLSGLPHLRGVITNLDGDELRRSLVSISAENTRRQAMFNEYNESHPEDRKPISGIRGYTEKYRQGKVKLPLPHLFIVVDEFAQMKMQLPDIMDQFISTAQIGRSLGVHLILATQSPSGVVDSKIRANILKQLCLKVANSGESRDMIGTDLAAHIKEPGRGYLKIDNSLQQFQSAYGSGKLRLPGGDESTQLREVLDAIINYCKLNNIQKLPDIFCPPLPERTAFPKIYTEVSLVRPFGTLPIGIRDDPAKQFMGEYSLDVFSRNTLIVGAQLMGKTNLLQTILRGISELYTTEEVNVYILDFSSLFLKNYESLPQVGGVVTLQETEKIANLFRLLREEIEKRRQQFLTSGVSTFSAYRESGARDLPQILVFVDDLAVAKAYFPPDSDPLLAICKEGLSLGISVVATTSQPVGGMTYMPVFANRIALYNNDSSVYSTLFGRTGLRPKELPGRCLVSMDNMTFECQSFLAFDGQREIDRAEKIRLFCLDQIAKANGKKAVPIPFIPKDLTVHRAITEYSEAYDGGRLMFGLNYATVKPISIKLAAMGVFAVTGSKDDVRNFQRYILTVAENASGLHADFYVLDSIERSLQSFSTLNCVKAYSFLPEMAEKMLLEVLKIAQDRYNCITQRNTSVLDTAPTLVLMINSNEGINAISSNKSALAAWTDLTGKFKSMNICVIFGDLDNSSIPYGSEVLKKLREDRRLVFFDDLANLKIGELPYAMMKKYSGTFQKGDGYLILGNEIARIRVPNCPYPEKNNEKSIP